MSALPSVAELSRAKDMIWLLTRHANEEILETAGLDEAEVRRAMDAGGPRGDPEQFAADLEQLGPAFVKLGQLLSTRPDLVREPYRIALSRLQDDVDPVPVEEIEARIEKSLGARISKLFSDFDRVPVAAASLAQVHRATLRDGKVVAVKVLRPGVRERVLTDLDVLEHGADLIVRMTSFGKRFSLDDLFATFRRTLLRELNLQNEARNLARMREQLDGYDLLVVPAPVPDYSTPEVLTMDFVSGVPVAELSPIRRLEIDAHGLAEQLFRAYLDQVLVYGLFHADPHPGNVLITDNNEIGLIDLGMVSAISPHLRHQLVKLLLATTSGEGERVAEISIALGSPTETFNRREYVQRLSELVLRQQTAEVSEVGPGRTVMEMVRVAGETGLRPAPELTMVGKTLLNLDEINRLLAPDLNPSDVIRRHTQYIMSRQMKRSLDPSSVASAVLETFDLIQELPGRLNRLLDSVVDGEFTVRVHAVDEPRLMDNLQKIANRIAVALVLAALMVSAAMIMRIESGVELFGYPLLSTALFLLAAVLGLWLVFQVARDDRWTIRRR